MDRVGADFQILSKGIRPVLEWLRVLGLLYPSQNLCPVVLLVMVMLPEEPAEALDGTLHLTTGLRVVAKVQADGDLQPAVGGLQSPRIQTGGPGQTGCLLEFHTHTTCAETEHLKRMNHDPSKSDPPPSEL